MGGKTDACSLLQKNKKKQPILIKPTVWMDVDTMNYLAWVQLTVDICLTAGNITKKYQIEYSQWALQFAKQPPSDVTTIR